MSNYQANIITKNPATPTGPNANGSAPGMWRMEEVAYWVKQGLWPNPNIMSDPYFRYVSMLLSTTSLGNANNNLFVDSSGAFNPISRNGNTTQGSVTPYSANWSNYFDGTGDYLTLPDNAALEPGSSDLTWEMWINTSNSTQYATLYSRTTGSFATGMWSLMMNLASSTSGDLGLYVADFSGGSPLLQTTGVNVRDNLWHHIAVVRNGSAWVLYVDGVSRATATWAGTIADISGGPSIARDQFYTRTYLGYISNLRIVKGTAVYTAAFTPPTAPLTAITNTSLLTCQSNRFRDASTNNFTVTPSGDVRVTDFAPFSPGNPGITYNQSDITNWSGYFDGSGDYLTVPDNPAFSYGTGDFTIECWVYASGLGATRRLYYHITTSTTQVTIYQLNTNYVGFYASNAGTPIIDILSNTLLPANAWTHIAVARNGNTFTLYQNGVSVATGTSASSMPDPTGAVNIGALDNGGEAWLGYISNLRVVKGTAVYTGAFTPPTTNLTAISGTSLLTLQNAAFTDNSTNNFVITPNGNTTVTGNSPFNTVGYWSNYFDGSGDYLSLASNDAFRVDQGDWTIEAWVFLNTTATNHTFINRGIYLNSYSFYFGTSGTSLYYEAGTGGWAATPYTSSAGAVSAGQWIHVAAVRSGTSLFLYANGTRVLNQASASFGANTATPVWIGTYLGGTATLNGNMSNFRFVKGTALYTGATYTVPTEPLTAITNTSLLTCQSSRFIDNSANAFAITVNGNTSIQSFDPFYTSTIASNGGSMYFDGSGDYLSLPDSAALQLGSSSFTVEYWWYPVSISGYQTPFEKGYTSSGGLLMQTGNGDGVIYVYASGSAVITASTAVGTGRWNHVALVRNGTSLVLYLNGVSIGSATNSTNFNNTGVMGIGANVSGGGAGAYPINGYMSDVRVTKGTAVYTAAFTPPTAPVTPTAATTLLVNGMNAGIYDATAINDMETVGNAQVSFPTPFAPTNYWAGSFDGTGDYLSVSDNTALEFGSGDFTIELWAYLTATGGSGRGLISKGTTTGASFLIFQGGTNELAFYASSNGSSWDISSNQQFSSNIPLNTWHHIAVSRSGTTFRLFLNGALITSFTSSAALVNNASSVDIGTYGSLAVSGFLSNVRLVKGTAVYTAAFTPPTTPLTAITNTSLLTCQNKTFIDNSTNAFTITANGNATAGAIGPFTATGGTSVYFDGTGDYLTSNAASDLYTFGTGDFTIEMWFNLSSFSSLQILYDSRPTSTDGLYPLIYVASGGGSVVWQISATAQITGTATLSTGVWYHLAVSRSSGSTKMFLNGTQVGSTYADTNAYLNSGTTRPFIGGSSYSAGTLTVNGYIEEVRVTKGYARYTSNFTPPTQAFPTY